MKCKECGKEINLQIFGMPPDICWGCLNKEGKDEVLDINIDASNVKKSEKIKKS